MNARALYPQKWNYSNHSKIFQITIKRRNAAVGFGDTRTLTNIIFSVNITISMQHHGLDGQKIYISLDLYQCSCVWVLGRNCTLTSERRSLRSKFRNLPLGHFHFTWIDTSKSVIFSTRTEEQGQVYCI